MLLIKSANTISVLQIIYLCQSVTFPLGYYSSYGLLNASDSLGAVRKPCDWCAAWDLHGAGSSLTGLACGSSMKTAKGGEEASGDPSTKDQ